jgi:hypothetical protein
MSFTANGHHEQPGTMREEFELRSFIPAVEHPKAVLELANFLESNKAILIEYVATHGWLKTLARVGNGEVPEGDSMCYSESFAHGVASLSRPESFLLSLMCRIFQKHTQTGECSRAVFRRWQVCALYKDGMFPSGV